MTRQQHDVETPTLDQVVLTQQEFDALADGSARAPEFVGWGQQWKSLRDNADATKGWMLGEYVKVDADVLWIQWRHIEVRG